MKIKNLDFIKHPCTVVIVRNNDKGKLKLVGQQRLSFFNKEFLNNKYFMTRKKRKQLELLIY